MTRQKPDCDRLGLERPQLAALTGFTYRAVRALAHLREAWCIADPGNADAVERAIVELMRGHSMQGMPRTVATVLSYGLDDGRAAQLLACIGLAQYASVARSRP